ncbi:MAG: hypothetical protein E7634_00665 [Ruminococcaceae bacterium]|nr:hypothetical protein [Oscillospiraceae bacterium]
MSNYDIYVFTLCLLVFVMLTGLLGTMLVVLLKQGFKLIRAGLEDERIKKEYIKEAETKRAVTIISAVLTVIMLIAIFSAFAVSMYVQFVGDEPKGGVAIPKVVLSDSMSKKRESNDYLEKHGLDDQFQTFDLIFIRELPGEFELELYDIVVYEYEDKLIIHRIIGIEEPNEKHPDCRHFLLRGDAAKFSDEFPVLYEQMKAIYEGQRIPFVGSFFAFMQSPAGYLCLLLIVFAVIATPITEKKLWEAKLARLREIGFIPAEPEPTEAEATEETAENDENDEEVIEVASDVEPEVTEPVEDASDAEPEVTESVEDASDAETEVTEPAEDASESEPDAKESAEGSNDADTDESEDPVDGQRQQNGD